MSDQYEVKKGDTLSDIAEAHYGDGGEKSWRRIYEANKTVIGANPDVIKPGQKLVIPPKEEEETEV